MDCVCTHAVNSSEIGDGGCGCCLDGSSPSRLLLLGHLLHLLVMLRELDLLKALTDTTVELEKLVETVFSAAFLALRHFPKAKIVNAVHEAHFSQFVVVEEKVFELSNFNLLIHFLEA